MVEPLTIWAGLVWTALQLATRAGGLDEGGDPADLIADTGLLTGKLTAAGRRTWEPHRSARARARAIAESIDAAAHGAQVPANELEVAKRDAQDRVQADLVTAGDELTAAITRLAGIDELRSIVHRGGGAPLRDWLNTPIPDAVVRLYPIVLDATLGSIAEHAQGTPTPEKRALRELLTDVEGLNRRLDRLDEFAARIPPVVSDLATWHARHLQDITDRYLPADFVGRKSEIDQITEFATSTTGPGWWWWRAPAWSGKTTLMAHLTFHLPDTVEVVPFFIRRAVAGADTAADVAAYVVTRLAQLIGFTAAPDVRGEWARQTNSIRDLLDLAATSCTGEGKTLLILIDGLDEDKVYSEDPATRSRSIPRLLPATLPTGVKVLLASRRNPELLRREVPEPVAGQPPHPLRDPRHHRDLEQSDAAEARRDDAQDDLDELLRVTHPRNPDLGDDLFRYIRASGGLLTSRELASLTRVGVSHLAEYLDHKHTARCFTKITGHGPGAVTVYQIAHDGLVDLYVEHAPDGCVRYVEDHTDPYEWDRHVRAALAPARDRLRAWASEYADRGWPENTPRYLLEDYPTALDPADDLDELVDYLTNPDWIQRVTAHSGTPFIAVDHIRRLLHHLRDRASNRPSQAGEGASSSRPFTSEPAGRDAHAAVLLAEALEYALAGLRHLPPKALSAHVLLGKPDLALHLATLDTPEQRNTKLGEVAVACAQHGHHTQALAGATQITDDAAQARALTLVATAATEVGDPDLVTRLLDLAHQAAIRVLDDRTRVGVLNQVATAAAGAGARSLANRLLTLAEEAAARITDDLGRAEAWAGAAVAAATVGDLGLVHRCLTSAHEAGARISSHSVRSYVLARVAMAAATVGEADLANQILDTAHDVVARVTHHGERVSALTSVATAAAHVRGQASSTEMFTDALTAALSITSSLTQARAIKDVATAAADAGEWEIAQNATAHISSADQTGDVLAQVAAAAAGAGQWTFAQEATARITDDWQRAEALARVATAAAIAGDTELAARLLDRAHDLAADLTDDAARALAMTTVATAAFHAGRRELANRLVTLAAEAADLIPPDDWFKTEALARAATVAVSAGEEELATRLLDLAHEAAGKITGPRAHPEALTAVATVAGAAGAKDLATRTLIPALEAATRISYDIPRDDALTRVAIAAADACQWDLVEKSAALIASDRARAEVLATIVPAGVAAGVEGVANRLLNLAFEATERITDDGDRDAALARVALAAADAGKWERARTAATAITASWARADASAKVAATAAAAGRSDLATHLLAQAQTAATSISDPGFRADVLTGVAAAAADAGDQDLATSLLRQAHDAATSIPSVGVRARTMTRIARTAAGADEAGLAAELLTQAQTAATGISDPGFRADVLAGVAAAAADAGDSLLATSALTRAHDAATSTPSPSVKARALTAVAAAALRTGDRALMTHLLPLAQEDATSVANSVDRLQALTQVATEAAGIGQWDAASEVAAGIADDGDRAHVWTQLAIPAADAPAWDIVTRAVADSEALGSDLLLACRSLLTADDAWRVAHLHGVDVSNLAADGMGSVAREGGS